MQLCLSMYHSCYVSPPASDRGEQPQHVK